MSTPPPGDGVRGVARFEWERLIRRSDLSSRAKLIAFVLASYGDSDGTRIHPGHERLALTSGSAPRTVERAIRELRDRGWITCVRQGNRHAGHANEYRLSEPANVLEALALGPDERPISPGLPVTHGGQTGGAGPSLPVTHDGQTEEAGEMSTRHLGQVYPPSMEVHPPPMADHQVITTNHIPTHPSLRSEVTTARDGRERRVPA